MAQSLTALAGIGRAPRGGHSRGAVRWILSPHPSPLPWGEGEPFSPRRTIQTRRLSTARCALFPLPEGEGQGEGKRYELPVAARPQLEFGFFIPGRLLRPVFDTAALR